ncbi:MAG: cytochrome c biogenesis protein CcdA [Phycisphaerae bacterium]
MNYSLGLFRRVLLLMILVAGGMAWNGPVLAQFGGPGPVNVTAKISNEPILQGSTARIAVKITIDPPFHVQSAHPNDEFLIATSIAATTPPGIHADATRYPQAKEIPAPPGSTDKPLSIYEGTVYALVPLTIDKDAPAGAATITVKVTTQACNADACDPPQTKKIQIPVTIAPAGAATKDNDPDFFAAADKQKFAEAPHDQPPATQPATSQPAATQGAATTPPPPPIGDGKEIALLSSDEQVALIKQRDYKPYNAAERDISLGWIVLFALVGGAILNIMPCVLPVIPLKVLSLVQQAHGDRKLAVLHAVTFSAGVISLFVALALALKLFGLFYGQQFQSPAFLIAMALFVIALALSMLGVWTINPPQAVYNVDTSHGGYAGSFTNGLMATLLATPCSAPYLGGVLGWALVQPAALTALMLALVGVGMSLPYLILAAFPKALAKVPRAGRWSELLKQGLGIVMLGVAVYLITLIPNVTMWPWVLLGSVVLGLICWGWGQIPTPSMDLGTIWMIRAVVLVVGIGLGIAVYWMGARVVTTENTSTGAAGQQTALLPDETTGRWIPFNVALMDAALKDGRPVVVDWTADWCINCRSLEAFVLSAQSVQDAFHNSRALLLRADLSQDNPPASAFNEKLGGHAIPVLAIFSPSRPLEPVVLRDSYTPTRVITELDNSRTGK